MYTLAFLVLLQLAAAKTISNVWQSLSISDGMLGNRPQDLRNAVITWQLSNSDVSANDDFLLNMPYVFRTKAGGTQLFLEADLVIYAVCNAVDASIFLDASSLSCTVTSAIESYPQAQASVSGSITFGFVFSAGGSSSSVDLQAASAFHAGTNTVTWSGLLATVNFAAGPYSSTDDTDKTTFLARTTPQGKVQTFALGELCPDGITSGHYQFKSDNVFDCSVFDARMSNAFNDFLLPEATADASPTYVCNGNTLDVYVANVPANYRVFIEGISNPPAVTQPVTFTFTQDTVCNSGEELKDTYSATLVIAGGGNSGDGNVFQVTTTTTTYDGSLTLTSTLPLMLGASTETVLIEVPYSELTTTTTTFPWTGDHLYTTTLSTSGRTVTVEVETPTTTTTTTTVPWTGVAVSTSTLPYASGDLTVTLEVEVPATTTTTVYTQCSGTEVHTTTLPISSGALTVTVEIATPTTVTTTTTTGWTGTEASTTTLPVHSGDWTVTVEVETPFSESATTVCSHCEGATPTTRAPSSSVNSSEPSSASSTSPGVSPTVPSSRAFSPSSTLLGTLVSPSTRVYYGNSTTNTLTATNTLTETSTLPCETCKGPPTQDSTTAAQATDTTTISQATDTVTTDVLCSATETEMRTLDATSTAPATKNAVAPTTTATEKEAVSATDSTENAIASTTKTTTHTTAPTVTKAETLTTPQKPPGLDMPSNSANKPSRTTAAEAQTPITPFSPDTPFSSPSVPAVSPQQHSTETTFVTVSSSLISHSAPAVATQNGAQAKKAVPGLLLVLSLLFSI